MKRGREPGPGRATEPQTWNELHCGDSVHDCIGREWTVISVVRAVTDGKTLVNLGNGARRATVLAEGDELVGEFWW